MYQIPTNPCHNMIQNTHRVHWCILFMIESLLHHRLRAVLIECWLISVPRTNEGKCKITHTHTCTCNEKPILFQRLRVFCWLIMREVNPTHNDLKMVRDVKYRSQYFHGREMVATLKPDFNSTFLIKLSWFIVNSNEIGHKRRAHASTVQYTLNVEACSHPTIPYCCCTNYDFINNHDRLCREMPGVLFLRCLVRNI